MDDSILRTNTEQRHDVVGLPKISSLYIDPLQLLEIILGMSTSTEEVELSDRRYLEDTLFEGQFQSWTAEQYRGFVDDINRNLVIQWVEPDSIRRYLVDHFAFLQHDSEDGGSLEHSTLLLQRSRPVFASRFRDCYATTTENDDYSIQRDESTYLLCDDPLGTVVFANLKLNPPRKPR
ncbi:MAG: hypothetical protein ACI9G1_003829 [Pirellulaceae bacterium]|jgi:hypothetical protein